MKKTTINLLVILVIFGLSGCGLGKMAKNANLIQYQVTPAPMEMHAEKVPVQVHVAFPQKYFHKKAYLVITPVIISDEGGSEIKLQPQTLQGEKVKDNNPIIPYKAGGSFSYHDTVAYSSEYRMSDLELRISARKGANGEELSFTNVKIADGIITTPDLVDEGLKVDNGTLGNTDEGLARTIEAEVKLPAESQAKETLTLYYPMQKSGLTSKEKGKDDIDSFVTEFKAANDDPDREFINFSIASYASPDGPEDINEELVDGRGESAQNFMSNELTKAKVEEAGDDAFYTRPTTPNEDWEGFKTELQESDMEQSDKDLITRVLDMHSDPNVREEQIKNMAAVYDDLRDDVLPQLRRAEIYATFKTRQKTEQELVTLGKTSPETLSQVELFYGAQSAEGADKETIYKSYIKSYPDDWKGHNNLAVYYIKANKLADAETYLQNAEDIDDNNEVITNNFGVLYWAKKDYKKAEDFFNKAKSIKSNDDIGYNLGVIQIKLAKYTQAVASFGYTDSFNKALAQSLAGTNTDAQTTISSVKSEEAYYYYLRAVLSARDTDETQTLSNLQKAVKADASVKDYAKNDMEFRNFFENETFKGIVD